MLDISGKICDGINYDKKCCSVEAPCAINEGDCDKNSECQGNLICGKDNCPLPFPLKADCCELPLVTNPFSKKISVAIVYKIRHRPGYRACDLLKNWSTLIGVKCIFQNNSLLLITQLILNLVDDNHHHGFN